ncbi:MAG: hypothetical protein ACOY3P_12450 [Planctomycetota bacterium]
MLREGLSNHVCLLGWALVRAAVVSLAAQAVFGVGAAAAVEFRLQNRVYVEGQKAPVSESTTLLANGLAYDVMQEPTEVIVYNSDSGRLTLLDPNRKVRTELTTTEVAAFAEQIRQTAQVSNDPVIQFMASPSFAPAETETPDTLVLASPLLSYHARGDASAGPEAALAYKDLANWLARLNTLLTPGGRPPFARIALNEALAHNGLLPREVKLSYQVKQGTSTTTVRLRSEHDLQRALDEADRRRLAEIGQRLAAAKLVSFDQYRLRQAK